MITTSCRTKWSIHLRYTTSDSWLLFCYSSKNIMLGSTVHGPSHSRNPLEFFVALTTKRPGSSCSLCMTQVALLCKTNSSTRSWVWPEVTGHSQQVLIKYWLINVIFPQLATMPDLIFRLTLLGIAACNCLISLFIEVSRSFKVFILVHLALPTSNLFYDWLVVKMSYNLQ